jgi:hypothetical protein
MDYQPQSEPTLLERIFAEINRQRQPIVVCSIVLATIIFAVTVVVRTEARQARQPVRFELIKQTRNRHSGRYLYLYRDVAINQCLLIAFGKPMPWPCGEAEQE